MSKHKIASLPKFLEPFLPSYDIKKMDLRNSYDKKLIIEAILNRGTTKEVKWLFRTYSTREIKNVVRKPSRGCWQARKLNYWTKVLEINIPKLFYEVAIMSLKPRPKLMRRYFNYLEHEGKVPERTLKYWRMADKIYKGKKSK